MNNVDFDTRHTTPRLPTTRGKPKTPTGQSPPIQADPGPFRRAAPNANRVLARIELTPSAGWDGVQSCDGVVARPVLVSRRCGSEVIEPFAGSAVPANAVALAQSVDPQPICKVRPLPGRATRDSARPDCRILVVRK